MMQQQPTIDEPPVAAIACRRLAARSSFAMCTSEFGYNDSLHGVNLRIPAGSTAAIVGHTGSGKSTLVNLIPRMIDTSEGSVLLDGHDVREYSPARLREQIGFVPQETFLFSLTLGENIALGVKDATEEQIRRAAEIAGLATDLESFPEGLRTMVGERGITLSGGQKQRTAIARAILRNPRILDSRRCALECGYSDGRADSYGPAGSDEGPHDDPDLSSSVHCPECRQNLRDRVRKARRRRDARGTHPARRLLCGLVPEAAFRGRVGGYLGCRLLVSSRSDADTERLLRCFGCQEALYEHV